MPTDMIDSDVGSGTETGFGRLLESLRWWGAVIAVVGGVMSILAMLGTILWLNAVLHAGHAERMEKLASIQRSLKESQPIPKESHVAVLENRTGIKESQPIPKESHVAVLENRTGIKESQPIPKESHVAVLENRTGILVNEAGIRAIKSGAEPSNADIQANRIGIAENRGTLAFVLKTGKANEDSLVLILGEIGFLKMIQEDFGRQQRLLQARQVEFSGKFDEFEARLAALAKTRARDAAETRSAAARMGDVEALVVDLDGRVKRLEDLILVSEDGAAAPSGGE